MLLNGYMVEKVQPSVNNLIAVCGITILLMVMLVCGLLFLTNPSDKAVNPSTASTLEKSAKVTQQQHNGR